MAIRSFDNSFAVPGYQKVLSGNTEYSHTPTVTNQQLYGSIDSISHPAPYYGGGAFVLNRTESGYGLYNGSAIGAFGLKYVRNMYSGPAPIASSHATLIGSTAVADILARSNPSKSSVNVPNFLFELKDIPQLMFKVGKGLPALARNIPEAYLQYKFGWAPLASDLQKLLGFQDIVDRRVARLSRMYREGGSRHIGELATGSSVGPLTHRGGLGYGLELFSRSQSFGRKWCQVSWLPDEDPRDAIPPIETIRRRAFDSVVSSHFDLSAAWDALPWSWLADYFGSFGSYLSSRRNSVGFHPGPIYVMTQRTALTFHTVTGGNSGMSCIPPYYRSETKQRDVPSAAAVFGEQPFLANHQLAILASIVATYRR